MKKIFIAALLTAFSSASMAHSHAPTSFGGPKDPINAITTTGVTVVNITIGNLNKTAQQYMVTVDGEVIGKTTEIVPGLFRTLPVPVRLNEPNTPEIHQVCSISIPKEGDMFKTKICTEAKLYWNK